MQEALADCQVGVSKTLTVDVTPLAVDGVLVAKVDGVSYTKDEAAPAPDAAPAPVKKAYKPKVSAPVE